MNDSRYATQLEILVFADVVECQVLHCWEFYKANVLASIVCRAPSDSRSRRPGYRRLASARCPLIRDVRVACIVVALRRMLLLSSLETAAVAPAVEVDIDAVSDVGISAIARTGAGVWDEMAALSVVDVHR